MQSQGKVQPWHRDRLAVIYVRQSSRQQVLDHGESTRLQYGLTERAAALGWRLDRRRLLTRARKAPNFVSATNGTTEGKPRMASYAADGLAASGEVLPPDLARVAAPAAG